MSFDIEPRKTICNGSGSTRHILPRVSSYERIEDTSQDRQRGLCHSGFLLCSDIGDIIDQDECLSDEFLARIGQSRHAAYGLQSDCHIDIGGIVLPTLLNKLRIEYRTAYTVTMQVEPTCDQPFAYLCIIEQVLYSNSILLNLCG